MIARVTAMTIGCDRYIDSDVLTVTVSVAPVVVVVTFAIMRHFTDKLFLNSVRRFELMLYAK